MLLPHSPPNITGDGYVCTGQRLFSEAIGGCVRGVAQSKGELHLFERQKLHPVAPGEVPLPAAQRWRGGPVAPLSD